MEEQEETSRPTWREIAENEQTMEDQEGDEPPTRVRIVNEDSDTEASTRWDTWKNSDLVNKFRGVQHIEGKQCKWFSKPQRGVVRQDRTIIQESQDSSPLGPTHPNSTPQVASIHAGAASCTTGEVSEVNSERTSFSIGYSHCRTLKQPYRQLEGNSMKEKN